MIVCIKTITTIAEHNVYHTSCPTMVKKSVAIVSSIVIPFVLNFVKKVKYAVERRL